MMYIYSLTELKLITKFRVSPGDTSQTDCIPQFAPDRKYLYHIEGRDGGSLNSRLSIYSTEDYRLVMRLFESGPKIVFSNIEFDPDTHDLFLLGYYRKERCNDCFIGRLVDQSLQDVRSLDENKWWFYTEAIHIKQSGFTESSYKWSSFAIVPLSNHVPSLKELKQMRISLATLWKDAGNNL